jgi:monovalent cation:proton antiporter-2 (CPA2) family protein
MTLYFIQAFVYLCAAVIAVPLAKKMGLGSVLGYLIAGVVIGPVIGIVGKEAVAIQHFAEFGVVMMMFLIGLELEPRMLWEMRNRLIGLGGLQVAATALIVMAISMAFGFTWSMAITIGLIFSLSSTAIVLQTFQEKGLTKTEGGKNAFSVLLFQDIAVIPMLALIPLLASPALKNAAKTGIEKAGEHHPEISLVAELPNWLHALVVVAAIVGVIGVGHFLSQPLFKFVASAGIREIFTATALMLVIGIAALMSMIGLSPALGTFLAGVVLATSDFRHELESNVEPFKGLLIGLFFITVGAGVDFNVLAENGGRIFGMTLGVMSLKILILFALAVIFKIKSSDRWLFSLSMAQAGYFGIVLLNYSVQNFVLPQSISQTVSLVVVFSMFLTPGLFILFEKVILPRFEDAENTRKEDSIDEKGTAIIAGIGRFGQIVNRMLIANGVKTIVLDHQPSQIDMVRRVNIKSYFGDATRPDLLHTAGIEEAKLLIIAIDDQARSIDLVEYVKHTYPQVKILARAYDQRNYFELKEAGADFIVSETYHSALEMGKQAMIQLGTHPFRAEHMKLAFDETDKEHVEDLFKTWKLSKDEDGFCIEYKEVFLKLEKMLSEAMQWERTDGHTKGERGWTPPPKGYAEKIDEDFEGKKIDH